MAGTEHNSLAGWADDVLKKYIPEAEYTEIESGSLLMRDLGGRALFDPATGKIHLSTDVAEGLVELWVDPSQLTKQPKLMEDLRSLFHEALHSVSKVTKAGEAAKGPWWIVFEEGLAETGARRMVGRVAFGDPLTSKWIGRSLYEKEMRLIAAVERNVDKDIFSRLWAAGTNQERMAIYKETVDPWIEKILADKIGKNQARAAMEALGDESWHVIRTGFYRDITQQSATTIRRRLAADWDIIVTKARTR